MSADATAMAPGGAYELASEVYDELPKLARAGARANDIDSKDDPGAPYDYDAEKSAG